MSISTSELPLLTAAQQLELQWMHDRTDTPDEKISVVIDRIKTRVRGLVEIIPQIARGNLAVHDMLAYVAGANDEDLRVINNLMSEIAYDHDVVKFLKQVEMYLGERFLMPDFTDLHVASDEFQRAREAELLDEMTKKIQLKQELDFQVHRFLNYLREQAAFYSQPTRVKIARLLVRGIGSVEEMVNLAVLDRNILEAFAIIEELLYGAAEKPEFIELSDLIELLNRLERENPIAH